MSTPTENLYKRIKAFDKLGKFLDDLPSSQRDPLFLSAKSENPWFTDENVSLAIQGIARFINEGTLTLWLSKYRLPQSPKTVALVPAGNIPLVGFHDMLCVLISGHLLQLKLSSKDAKLPQFIIQQLIEIEPSFADAIFVVDRLQNFDAVIATGSDNSARYFDYYFQKYPHIIRKNRTSCAVLDDFESDEELLSLGKDVFSYFGLGCRNVSKLFVPEGYSFNRLLKVWEPYQDIIHHHKYCNNYDYQKSIMLVNKVPFFDNGFVLLTESEKLVSPISTLHYEVYTSQDDLKTKLDSVQEKIQCIVGHLHLPFGTAQFPEVWDYADNVDTIKFLESI